MNKTLLYLLIVLVSPIVTGCGVSLPAPSARVDTYPGFDTWRYPGDDLMNVWRRASPYRWVGYYLPSPCHRDTSFSGKRDFLTQGGWGIAVLYVGQQLFEGQVPAEITESTLCTSRFLTTERGGIDGRDAVARAAAEGFPPGTVIFLDIERTETIPTAMIDYYQAWIRAVMSDGRYRPGTYAHVGNSAALYSVAQTLLQRAGETESIPFWIAGGSGFSLEAAPRDVRYSFAAIWQGVLDIRRSWGGRELAVDENVARSPSPSLP